MATAMRDGARTVDPHAPVPLDVVTPLSGSGVTTRIRDAILVVDKHEVVFALGKFAVVHNLPKQELVVLSGQQPVSLPSPPPSLMTTTRPHQHQHTTSHKCHAHADHTANALGAITAMAQDGKRNYVSICRKAIGNSGATVSIHSLKGSSTSSSTAPRQRGTRLKVLSFKGADRFSGVAMSTDGKLVCCQSANASWTLVVWDWSRERQIAVSDVHCKVTRVRFNVIDMAQLSTSGGSQLKLWTLSEYTLKIVASFKSGDETRVRHAIVNYVDHVWLPDDCLVALLEDGSVQLIINGELLQTVQVFATSSDSRAHCIVTQNNGEAGVMVGGSDGTIACLRIVSKIMNTGEKEMHLQRRMKMANAQHIYAMGVDATGAMLVCTTERFYGSYDLSNQCLLLGEDESHSLFPLSSTPFVSHMKSNSLCSASRRPCFASLGKLPTGEDSLFVWNQWDGHECFLSQTLEPHTSPLCVDLHPTGAELVIASSAKVVIYFLLQDSVKVGFEVHARHVSHVAYSTSGTHLLVTQSSSRTILIYRSFGRDQREPELTAEFHGVDVSIACIAWSLNDRSFFYADGGAQGELRHCKLLLRDVGDVDEAITLHSATKLLDQSQKCVAFTSSKLQHDSHDYVLFAVEQETRNTSASVTAEPSKISSCVRAWMNGDLHRDALRSGASVGLALDHDVTAIATGPGKLLIAGTAEGLVIFLYWGQGRLTPDGSQSIFVMATLRHVDLHATAVIGLIYSRCTRSLLSSDATGVVLVSSIKRLSEAGGVIDPRRALGMKSSFDDDAVFADPSQTFVSVCQADEVALYDRNAIELRKLKFMDVESELQQLKLENEMLTKQLHEQKRGHDDRLKAELTKHRASVERREHALTTEWETRLRASDMDRHGSIATLHQDAQLARDQYLASTDTLQTQCELLRNQLLTAKHTIEDLQLGSEEAQTQLRETYEKRRKDAAATSQAERHNLQMELDDTRKKLREVLMQQDQDQLTQLSLLSSNVDQEKARAAAQLSQIQGKMAALHQEVKMLLTALNQKDHEIFVLQEKLGQDTAETTSLREQLQYEQERSAQLEREKHKLEAEAHEQKLIRDNLQHLNSVHRSQIEMLQKTLLPKERELENMQHHLDQLHTVNQEVVGQANRSDRLRKETGARAKQNESEARDTHELLEHVRSSIVVLHDELGELVRQSAVQEKYTIVDEIMRIHKKISRQVDVLQVRDGRVEEVCAELHRQNWFLLKSKQHLRHQADMSRKEKHKLVSALSFQNTTLLNDMNDLRRQNKELSRLLGLQRQDERKTKAVKSVREEAIEAVEEEKEEVDGRRIVAPASSSVHTRPSSASTSGPSRLQQIARRSSIRPKSAVARPKR